MIDRLVPVRSSRDDGDLGGATREAEAGVDVVHRSGEVTAILQELAQVHARRWKGDLVERPDRLVAAVVELLVDMRLAERVDHEAAGGVDQGADHGWSLRILPGAARFALAAGRDTAGLESAGPDTGRSGPTADDSEQASLW